MPGRTISRLHDIVDAIEQIDLMLQGKTLSELSDNRVLRAAFERFLEIISEAARHLPDQLKNSQPEISWRRIADLGNHLRHAYHRTDPESLWRIYADGHLRELKAAVVRILRNATHE